MCTGELTSVTKNVAQSKVYSAISCDICDLDSLSTHLEHAGVDFTTPTLILAEVVLTYINAKRYHYGNFHATYIKIVCDIFITH